MQLKNRSDPNRLLLMVLLLCGSCWRRGAAQVTSGEQTNKAPDGGYDNAFFAPRSCHQLLRGDSGEFFSPDYLCSNPSLWCNWTVQVEPGKRIHLELEDLTPDDVCHLKRDQIHVDEPAGRFGVHKVLQRCWREAKFTSSTNALTVVLLIGGWPDSPYRGFYGSYQAFGPPVMYNPQEGFAARDEKPEPPLGPMDVADFGPVMNADRYHPANFDPLYDYDDQSSVLTPEQLWQPADAVDAEVDENLRPLSGNVSHVHSLSAVSTPPVSTEGTSPSGRDAAHIPSTVDTSDPQREPSGRTPAAVRRNVDDEDASPRPEEDASPRPEEDGARRPEVDGARRPEVDASPRPEVDASPRPEEDGATRLEEDAGSHRRSEEEEPKIGPEAGEESGRRPSASEGPEPGETEQIHPQPNMVEPLSDLRGHLDIRNQSTPHLPGDHMFEVTVEVDFSPAGAETWDHVSTSLLRSVKALISGRLEDLHTSLSAKRIKRLNAGVLFILWLQTGPGPGSQQVHRAVHVATQSLLAAALGGSHRRAVVVSVSTADVNECGTQLVLCDVNADCVNRFGSYSCHCRPGLLDQSRLGSGGTVCVDPEASGCGPGRSAETKGVYVLFFLLSAFILMLLAAAGTLYHRHHRGAFLVRCRSGSIGPPDPNNNRQRHDCYSSPGDSDMPPPPPPPRAAPRDAWPQVKELCPAVDLPLLRFSPLVPPDGHMEPRPGGKM